MPNIPSDVMENRDPALHQRMQLRPALASDDITFIQDAVKAVDIVAKTVAFLPNERPGEERETLSYDYLVIAMSAHLAYDRIPGFAEYGHTVSDLFPLLADAGAAEMVALLSAEHAAITPYTQRLAELARQGQRAGFDAVSWAAFHAAGAALAGSLAAHVEKEEMGLLPALDALLDVETDGRLALELAALR